MTCLTNILTKHISCCDPDSKLELKTYFKSKNCLLYSPLEKSVKTLRGVRLCTDLAVQRKDVRLPILDTQPILSPPDVVSTAIALVVFINILLLTIECFPLHMMCL